VILPPFVFPGLNYSRETRLSEQGEIKVSNFSQFYRFFFIYFCFIQYDGVSGIYNINMILIYKWSMYKHKHTAADKVFSLTL